jgi:inner membrane protein
MDIVTHGLAGALVARAATARPGPAVLAASVGGALAPDLDVLARLWDPMAAITVHRTMTHSLLGGLAVAAVVAELVALKAPRRPFLALAGLAYLGVLSHIGLDLLTPFGTAALWPLTSRRFGAGWLFIIDPVVIGLVLGGLFVAWRSKGHRVAAPRWALGMLVGYALAAGAFAASATTQWESLLAARGIVATRLAVIPAFPGPWHWIGVAETDRAVYRAGLWLAGGPTPELATFPIEPLDGLAQLEASREVRTFRTFARFPWLTLTSDGDLRRIEYHDLAFADHPFGGPMTLRLTLDPSGAIRTVELGHRL